MSKKKNKKKKNKWIRSANKRAKKQLPAIPKNETEKSKYHAEWYKDNKAVKREKHRQYYKDNKKQVNKRVYKRRAEWYYRLFKRKYDMKCMVCGTADIRILDLHHLDPATKVDSVSALVNRGTAWHRIEDELAKCAPICANCHRIEHFEDNRRWDFLTWWLIDLEVFSLLELADYLECDVNSLKTTLQSVDFRK